LDCCLTGLDMPIIQSERDQLLEASIDFLVHGRILGRNVTKLLEQSAPAVVVIRFGSQKPLTVVAGSLARFHGICLRVDRPGPLHGLSSRGASHSSLTSGILSLPRSLTAGWGGVRRTGPLRRRIVMDPPHMVKKIPPAGKSVSWHRSVTSFKEAEMRVISVAVESVGLTLVAEKTCIGRKLQLGIQASGFFAAIWFQVGVQVFAARISIAVNPSRRESLTDRRIFGSLADGCTASLHW
jgi:hypothetical protein